VKKNSEITKRLEELMEFERAGSPMGDGLYWTYRSPRKIAKQLCKEGYEISAMTVRKILLLLGYSVRKNRRCLSRPSPPGRNQQFQKIFDTIKFCQRHHIPIICVDTKKKEIIGWFVNAGGIWCKKAIPVNDHDFLSYAEGKAVPYGVYDRLHHREVIYVGDSKDTPEFAVDCITKWFCTEGRTRYPNTDRLVILADCGGSNSNRAKAWKYFLQKNLNDPHQLQVTVAHFPSGSSKWNPIEHRRFSAISTNWKGRPLDSFETIMNYILTTTDTSGLKVDAVRVTKQDETGIKISKQEMETLNLVHHKELPQWNYDIYPRKG